MSEAGNTRRNLLYPPDGEGEAIVSPDLTVLLADFIKGLKRYWWLVAVLVVAVPTVNLYRNARAYRPLYKAEATFTVSTRATTSYGSDDYTAGYQNGTVTQMARTFPYILRSEVLLQVIREDLRVRSLNGTLSARGLEDTNLFVLSVTGSDPADALRILHSAIRNYPRVAEYIIGDTRLNMLAEPSVSSTPVNWVSTRSTLRRGGLTGLAAGLGLVALYALLRRTIRKADDIRTKLNQKNMGVLPRMRFKRRSGRARPQLIILNRQVCPSYKESIRGLRSRVTREMNKAGAKTLMVTSTLTGEGKSTVALNLALSIAQKGSRVALVDADLRRQDIRKLLGLKEPPATLAQALRGEATPEQARFELFVRGFFFVPCGLNRDQSVEVLRSAAFMGALEDLKRQVDYVILDTPPCGMLADALALAGVSDCLLYVIRQDTAPVSRVIDGLQSISCTGVRILGCVLNDAGAGFTGYGYGYGYGRYAYAHYGAYGETERGSDRARTNGEESLARSFRARAADR